MTVQKTEQTRTNSVSVRSQASQAFRTSVGRTIAILFSTLVLDDT
jgi:hypothetical protein